MLPDVQTVDFGVTSGDRAQIAALGYQHVEILRGPRVQRATGDADILPSSGALRESHTSGQRIRVFIGSFRTFAFLRTRLNIHHVTLQLLEGLDLDFVDEAFLELGALANDLDRQSGTVSYCLGDPLVSRLLNALVLTGTQIRILGSGRPMSDSEETFLRSLRNVSFHSWTAPSEKTSVPFGGDRLPISSYRLSSVPDPSRNLDLQIDVLCLQASDLFRLYGEETFALTSLCCTYADVNALPLRSKVSPLASSNATYLGALSWTDALALLKLSRLCLIVVGDDLDEGLIKFIRLSADWAGCPTLNVTPRGTVNLEKRRHEGARLLAARDFVRRLQLSPVSEALLRERHRFEHATREEELFRSLTSTSATTSFGKPVEEDEDIELHDTFEMLTRLRWARRNFLEAHLASASSPVTVQVVVPSMRPERLMDVLAFFRGQITPPLVELELAIGLQCSSPSAYVEPELEANEQLVPSPIGSRTGLALARAITVSRSELVVKFDDDDLYSPFAVEELLSHYYLSRKPCVATKGHFYLFEDADDVLTRVRKGSFLPTTCGTTASLFMGTKVAGNAMLFERRMVNQVGMPCNSIGFADSEWFRRVVRLGESEIYSFAGFESVVVRHASGHRFELPEGEMFRTSGLKRAWYGGVHE